MHNDATDAFDYDPCKSKFKDDTRVNLNQYYTNDQYSDHLIRALSHPKPTSALDLGFGAGGLLYAARRRWSNINLVGVDLDEQNVQVAKNSIIEAINLNVFSFDLPEIIEKHFGNIDILVSNPPFFSKNLDPECLKILKDSGLINFISPKNKTVPAELIFLAQNLRILKDNGEIGIILPAGLISGERWKKLREYLFSIYEISNIIQLPENSFKGTEAQTFIVNISKKSDSKLKNDVTLSHVSKKEKIHIDLKQAFYRADYSYYEKKKTDPKKLNLCNDDFNIFRGKTSYKTLKERSYDFLHTTKMPRTPQKTNLINQPISDEKNVCKGDIIIARVGRRCLGRVSYISNGSLPISDCIIAIRPKNKQIGTLIWNKISSKNAIEHIKDTSLGVGARYITHNLIQEFLIKD